MQSIRATEPPAEPDTAHVHDDVQAAKALLRSRIRATRRRRSPAERERLGVGLRDVALGTPALRPASVVACYLNSPTEPYTGPLRAALAAAGITVLLPVVGSGDDGPVLDWAADDGTVRPGPYSSFPEPAGARLGPSAVGDADVVFVPALAVDTLGRRLGQGGGYYDRALARAALKAPVVAVLHDDEVLDADVEPVPALAHDRGVDAVLTPSRWMAVRS